MRNRMLKGDYKLIKKEIDYLNDRYSDLRTQMTSMVQYGPVPNIIYERMIDINNRLPAAQYELDIAKAQIVNEKNYIESLVKAGKMSNSEAIENINLYNKLISKFESPDCNVDNIINKGYELLKQNLSENSPTTVIDNATTVEPTKTTNAPISSEPEVYIQNRNKILTLRIRLVMRDLREAHKQQNTLQSELNMKAKLPKDEISNNSEEIKIRLDCIKEEVIPKLEKTRNFFSVRIQFEKYNIKALEREGKMTSLEAEKYINKLDQLSNEFKDLMKLDDNERQKRDLPKLSEKLESIALKIKHQSITPEIKPLEKANTLLDTQQRL
jgi:hypothetical protein